MSNTELIELSRAFQNLYPFARFVPLFNTPNGDRYPAKGSEGWSALGGFTSEELKSDFSSRFDAIAVVLTELVAFDCDSPEAVAAFSLLKAAWCLPETLQITSGNPGRFTALYKLENSLKVRYKPDCSTLEIRTGAKLQTLFGKHQSGSIYKLSKKPIALLPQRHYQVLSQSGFVPKEPELVLLQGVLNEFPDYTEVYEDWIKVGMICHYESDGSDEGLALWKNWSRSNPRYSAESDETYEQKWNSFEVSECDSPLTIATLYKELNDRKPGKQDDFASLVPQALISKAEKSLFEKDWQDFLARPFFDFSQHRLNSFEETLTTVSGVRADWLLTIALNIMSGLLPKKFSTRFTGKSTYPQSFLCIVGDQATGKSALMYPFISSLKERAVQHNNDFVIARQNHKKQVEQFSKLPKAEQLEMYLAAIGEFEGDDVDLQSKLDVCVPAPLDNSRLFASDATLEAIQKLSSRWRDRAFNWVKDELDELIATGNKAKKADSLKPFVEIWDGNDTLKDRSSVEEGLANFYRVALIGGIQPGLVDRVAQNEDPSGFWSRFNFISFGSFVFNPFQSDLSQVKIQFDHLVERLMFTFDAETEIRLSGTAQGKLQRFYEHCHELALEADHVAYRGYLRRLHEKTLKIAQTMYVCDVCTDYVPHDHIITDRIMDKAIAWGLWQIEEGKRFFKQQTKYVPTEKLEIFQRMLKICKGQKVTFSQVRNQWLFRSQEVKNMYCEDSIRLNTPTKVLNKKEVFQMWQEMHEYGLAYFDAKEGSLMPK